MVKWVVFPTVFALVGYFLLGPKIGTDNLVPPSLRDHLPGVNVASVYAPDANEPAANKPPEDSGLDIDVTVRPSEGRRRR
ncbi:MAG: hypothetical protein KF812_09075 [Fimbriimonadaceae bacterium]|nr:hypothetical protein [Fimbriimonadaceae bacterium]